MPLKLASFALGKTLLLKILNVSERTRIAVVLISNKFFVRKIDAIRPEQDAVTAHV